MTTPSIPYVGLPIPVAPQLTDTKYFFQALDNFSRVMAIRAGDRVLMLADPLALQNLLEFRREQEALKNGGHKHG